MYGYGYAMDGMDGMEWDAYLGAFPAQLLHVSTVRPPIQEMCCGSRFRSEFVELAIDLGGGCIGGCIGVGDDSVSVILYVRDGKY
jgi:hypothetical protein